VGFFGLPPRFVGGNSLPPAPDTNGLTSLVTAPFPPASCPTGIALRMRPKSAGDNRRLSEQRGSLHASRFLTVLACPACWGPGAGPMPAALLIPEDTNLPHAAGHASSTKSHRPSKTSTLPGSEQTFSQSQHRSPSRGHLMSSRAPRGPVCQARSPMWVNVQGVTANWFEAPQGIAKSTPAIVRPHRRKPPGLLRIHRHNLCVCARSFPPPSPARPGDPEGLRSAYNFPWPRKMGQRSSSSSR